MQDNRSEEFVSVDERVAKKFKDLQKKLKGIQTDKDALHDGDGAIVKIGDVFNLGGQNFRIRKITNKDIICRPVKWDQSD